ncbi:hypothetical protein BJV82DRAFT_320182 [Fennellomyces sp. T-0311]|nr:hypothetical protein BJV82DRAFT_320182 [Fennellomyces sp. T-0311]
MSIPKRSQSLLQRSWSFPNAPPPECDARKRSNTTTYVLPPLRSSSLTEWSANILHQPQTDDLQDEEASSLLEWKRQSILLRASTVPVVPDEKDECQEMADALWRGDKVPEASFLGRADPFSQCTLELYFAKFNFSAMRVDDAFRVLCRKVYFKAEAQEIDRILEAFAYRYWSCNKDTLYGSADVVYAVIYSLMLLNTDLHIAKGHTRMSRLTFCRNTVETIRDFVPKETYKRCEAEIETLLKELYNSVKQQGFMHHENTSNTKSRTLLRRIGSFTQKDKNKSIRCMQKLHAASDYKALYLVGKMLYKAVPASTVTSKHNRRTATKRNNHERYRECWVSLGPGYLQIEQHFGSRLGTKTSCHELFHAFAIPHAPSWHHDDGPSPYGFLLQLSGGHAYIFTCDSKNQVQTWVRQCNYWAARESKIPLRNGVGNSTYFGWEPVILTSQLHLDTIDIDDWFPPPTGNNSGSLANNMDEQCDSITAYLSSLRAEREEHVALFDPIDQVAVGTTKWAQVHANWTAKKIFLDQQIQKYTAYICAIQEQKRTPFASIYDDGSSWLSEMDLHKEISDELRSKGSKPLL